MGIYFSSQWHSTKEYNGSLQNVFPALHTWLQGAETSRANYYIPLTVILLVSFASLLLHAR